MKVLIRKLKTMASCPNTTLFSRACPMLCPRQKTDPFELPKNYRSDVEAALKTGCMTLETNKSFLSTVAVSMFVYKKYPKADDYNNVARVMIKMYPFMRSPTGKPCVSFLKGTVICLGLWHACFYLFSASANFCLICRVLLSRVWQTGSRNDGDQKCPEKLQFMIRV